MMIFIVVFPMAFFVIVARGKGNIFLLGGAKWPLKNLIATPGDLNNVDGYLLIACWTADRHGKFHGGIVGKGRSLVSLIVKSGQILLAC